MEQDFWVERWESNQIGFHQEDYSPYLLKHWHSIITDTDANVFVPMAGKSKDILWLANNAQKVLAIELSEIAVKAFFDENEITAIQKNTDSHILFSANNIDFLCGDFFKLRKEDTNEVSAVFDRASLVAMPTELRKKYATHMCNILNPGVSVLLVSMEYPTEEMSGPPFCVSEANIHELYSNHFSIELIETNDVLENNPHLKERGLTSMLENIFHMVRK